MKLLPKNWREFQHYTKRNPPWIKLYRNILDDMDFQTLDSSTQCLAIMLWLVASEQSNGVFDASPEKLSFRLRKPKDEIEASLPLLIEKGLFIDASGPQAQCLIEAMPEKEKEKERQENIEYILNPTESDNLFTEFWGKYPKKHGKKNAEQAWQKLTHEQQKKACSDIKSRFDEVAIKYIPMPEKYIEGERWEDEITKPETVFEWV